MNVDNTKQTLTYSLVIMGTMVTIFSMALAFPSHAAPGVEYCEGKDPITSPNDVMVKVGPICVDKYEASVWSEAVGDGLQSNPALPAIFPENGNWTQPLYAMSKRRVLPRTMITWFQAQQACALSGKRLLTNAEWQMAAAGTPDPGANGDGVATCNTNTTGPRETGKSNGSKGDCVSNWGVSDMVGNVLEWVADWIQGPGGVSFGNVVTKWDPNTHSIATPEYGNDYIGRPFPAAIYRGGMWTSVDQGGVFMFAQDSPSSMSKAIGFRCAK